MPEVFIERMRMEDLDEVLATERGSFPNPWSRDAFVYELRSNRVAHLWIARTIMGAVVGYLCLWFIADEVHVTNFAVHPDYRHRGIGRHLMGTLLDHYRQQGATRAGLEVRPSNREACGLYAQFCFRPVGVRKGYYFDTGEDALVMEARLAPEASRSPDVAGTPRGS